MKAQIYPDFNQQHRVYSLNPQKNGIGLQLDDLLSYIMEELSSINGGIQLRKNIFVLRFITNMTDMNKLNFFKKEKLYSQMVNSIPNTVPFSTSIKRSKYYLTDYFELENINYINKGAIYIIWNKENDDATTFEEKFLNQAGFFLTAAIPFFQLVSLDETIMDGIEKFHISNEKNLINFNEWVYNYKKTYIYIYRIPYKSIIELFAHLKKHSDFSHDRFIEEIKQEEFELVQKRNQFNEQQKNKIMEIILFIISIVSILQVIDIFTDNIIILSVSAVITIIISIIMIIYINQK